MSSLEFLDSISIGTEADEGSAFFNHPLGTFKGTVMDVKQKIINDKPVWEFTIQTAFGNVQHSRWGFSTADMRLGASNQDAKDKMIQTVKRHKRLFVDLGVVDAERAKGMAWNDILQSWVRCISMRCQVVVKADHKKPGYATTFVNAYSDAADINEGTLPPPPREAKQAAGYAVPGNNNAGGGLRPPGTELSMDQIPF